jgi:hypothetical protein
MHFSHDLLDAIEEAFPRGSGPDFVELGPWSRHLFRVESLRVRMYIFIL